MKFDIEYAVFCHKGKIRTVNQDNFWCKGIFLDSENAGLPVPLTGITDTAQSPIFAVFDGMGGEEKGEIAAYTAARCFDSFSRKKTKKNVSQFLVNSCLGMNKAICDYAEEKNIQRMGTTTAILQFGRREIYICNVGDSRIYQYSKKKLTQISCDHNMETIVGRKPSLTQNLGIPQSEFIIEPYISKGVYVHEDIYLICSDGLTDMLMEEEIVGIMNDYGENTQQCGESLLQKALENGGHDNITLILCRINKPRKFLGFGKKRVI